MEIKEFLAATYIAAIAGGKQPGDALQIVYNSCNVLSTINKIVQFEEDKENGET